MKYFLLAAILFMTSSYIFAEEEVLLDLNVPAHKLDTGKLDYGNKKTDAEEDESYLKPSFSVVKKMFDEDFRNKKENKTGQKVNIK